MHLSVRFRRSVRFRSVVRSFVRSLGRSVVRLFGRSFGSVGRFGRSVRSFVRSFVRSVRSLFVRSVGRCLLSEVILLPLPSKNETFCAKMFRFRSGVGVVRFCCLAVRYLLLTAAHSSATCDARVPPCKPSCPGIGKVVLVQDEWSVLLVLSHSRVDPHCKGSSVWTEQLWPCVVAVPIEWRACASLCWTAAAVFAFGSLQAYCACFKASLFELASWEDMW